MNEQGKKALVTVAEWLERGAPHVQIESRDIGVFDMGEAVSVNHENDEGEPCGTACCIAGAVYQFEGLSGQSTNPTRGLDFFHDVAPKVTEFLNITEEQAEPLFLPWDHFEGDPSEFSDPALAAKVVRHFIETGEVDWNITGEHAPYDYGDDDCDCYLCR